MPLACNTAHDGASDWIPGTIDLEARLGDSDAQLVYEGLYRLRELTVDVLGVLRAEGVCPNGRDFEPQDFGIPQIDRLLARFCDLRDVFGRDIPDWIAERFSENKDALLAAGRDEGVWL